MCAFILAVGANELKQPTSHFFGLVNSSYSGIGVIGIACILILINLYDGIRPLMGFKYHTVLVLGLIAVYAFLSIRVVEIAWNFRVAYRMLHLAVGQGRHANVRPRPLSTHRTCYERHPRHS